ncbi:hypothetical protein V2J09_007120 [Rumex salicifolius]
MEAMGGEAFFLDEEWGSLCKIFSDVNSDLDFTHLLGNNNQQFSPDLVAPICTHEDSLLVPNLSNSSYGSTNYVNTLNHMTQLLNNEEQVSSLSPFDHFPAENRLSGDHATSIQRPRGDQIDCPDDHKKRKSSDDQIELPKKRARVYKNREKGKRKMQPKKKIEEEETINLQSLSCETSDNESNASQEMINEESKEIINIGKKRASRGAATDPQSLYARVDISTMLEEAVNYVKFLQLQIKLLSSDEMWMYAPLAYNGFDVGFYKKFSPYPQWP